MSFHAKFFTFLLAVIFIQSVFCDLIDFESEDEKPIHSKFFNESNFAIFNLSLIERETFQYREHLMDITRFFPGFDYNNELTDDGAEMFENGNL